MSQESQKSNTVLIIVAVIGVVGTIVASAIGAIGNYNTEKFRQEAELTQIALISIATQGGATQMVMQSTIDAPTQTPPPTLTFTPPPTNTNVPSPTATIFVPPADGILFEDNFDSGMSPDWVTEFGTWLVANGELTLLYEQEFNNPYRWIALRKPDWKNYNLSLNATYIKGTATGQVIIVRNNKKADLGVIITSSGNIYFAIVGKDYSHSTPIAGNNEGVTMPTGSNIEIEARDNIYTLKLSGREIQSITMSGYDTGGISLGVSCSWKECPKFDNIKVTYLP